MDDAAELLRSRGLKVARVPDEPAAIESQTKTNAGVTAQELVVKHAQEKMARELRAHADEKKRTRMAKVEEERGGSLYTKEAWARDAKDLVEARRARLRGTRRERLRELAPELVGSADELET